MTSNQARMPQRIDLGRALLALGAVLLLVSLFLDWYAVDASGWNLFESLDLLLALFAAGALYTAWAPDARRPIWGIPVATLIVVAVQLIDPPPVVADADPSTGAWIALGSALLMCLGAALSLASFTVTVQVRERDTRPRMAAVDRRDDVDEEPDDLEDEPPTRPTSLFEQRPEDGGRTQPFGVVPPLDDDPDPKERA